MPGERDSLMFLSYSKIPSPPPVCDLPVQFVKRDAIHDIEREVQQRWENERVFEIDAPKVASTSQ